MALDLSRRRVSIVAIDLLQFALCYYFAFLLRLDSFLLSKYSGVFWVTLPAAVGSAFVGMYLAGTYRGIWRYAGINDLVNVFKGALYGTVGLVAAVVFLWGTEGYPRSVFVINAALLVLAVGGSRFAWRFYQEILRHGGKKQKGRSVLIVGAGDAADDLLRELRQNPNVGMHPVGLVDDDEGKVGRELQGVKVVGTIGELPKLARELEPAEILIAIASATGEQMRRIVELCRKTGVSYRTLPGVGDILDGRVRVSQLRRVRVEDLLGREAVLLDREAVSGYLAGKKVLVTGAGGSIGSELCRQAARFGPGEIVFLDHAENSLFYLEEEFSRIYRGVNTSSYVADITNSCRMEEVFEESRPDVVFHAAAHKHVWLMERNFREAFRNNVTGTRVTAEAAAAAGVDRFVLVSTDKAVRPGNMMGLSKRVAELTVQGMNGGGGRTKFLSVRFGNVMGSEGSVIPLFYRQIKAGGPVTVTHPEVTRYFMTIPEAVQLVLQASSMGDGGEVFILEMGEPMKILDVARQVITLAGLEPEVDIAIKFIGLRPGEKLTEELVTEGEGIVPTGHEKIMVIRPEESTGAAELLGRIRSLEELVRECSGPREIIGMARKIVPEYSPSKEGGARSS